MPAYELFLLVKNFPRQELIQAIKKGAEHIVNRNGMIRSFENLGFKNLPYRIKSKEAYHTTGNYLLIKFDLPRQEITEVLSEIRKEGSFLRTAIHPLIEENEVEFECQCKEQGEFSKHGFNFEKPMTWWAKKKIYKNYGHRL